MQFPRPGERGLRLFAIESGVRSSVVVSWCSPSGSRQHELHQAGCLHVCAPCNRRAF